MLQIQMFQMAQLLQIQMLHMLYVSDVLWFSHGHSLIIHVSDDSDVSDSDVSDVSDSYVSDVFYISGVFWCSRGNSSA